ncbi:MAG: tetratricopeptide repeat protein [Caldilineaceae bacterium]
METPASLGLWIRQRRKQLDLTQEMLAGRVGCSLSAIRKIEADERRPSREVAELLADCLQIDRKDRPIFLKVARSELRTERLASVALPAAPPVPAPSPVPLQGEAAPSVSFPMPLTPLVGRAAEVMELSRLLGQSDCRLLTLVGPGGIGKTRLALAVAVAQQAAFAHGVTFVPLAALSSPDFVAPALANALGLTAAGATAPKTQLLNYLREKQLLLVLDNLEHLLEGVGLLSELLAAAPRLTVLATSRERLNLQGEWVFDLQGLLVPPAAAMERETHEVLKQYSAVTLFVENAQRADTSFALTATNLASVVRICQLLEGLPLGIELAAAWVHVLPCEEIAQEIERNLDFLATSRRDLFARHRSLRAVFDHSWQLLTPAEQQALQRLTVFQGGFTRELARQVTGVALPVLASLIAKSLVRRMEDDRYNLHEVVRQFGAEHLQQAGEAEALQRAYVAALLALAEATDLRRTHGPPVEAAIQRLRTERDNLRAALAWSTRPGQSAEGAAMGMRLAAALGQFWNNEGECREGRQWLEAALALPPARETRQARAQVLTSLGGLLRTLSEFTGALHCFAESLVLSHALGDEWMIASTQCERTQVLLYQRDLVNAQLAIEDSRQRFRALGDAWGIALSHWMMAVIAGEQGRHQAALPWLEENLTLFKKLQSESSLAVTYVHLGNAAMHTGEFARAAQALQTALSLYQKLKRKGGIRWTLVCLGRLMQRQGDAMQARRYLVESLKLAVEMEDKLATVDIIGELACAAQMLGDAPRAACLFAVEAAFRKALGTPLPGEKEEQHNRLLTATRTQLGEAAFTATWAKGQLMSLAQAVALALTQMA